MGLFFVIITLNKPVFLKIAIVLSIFLVLEYEKTNTLPRNTNYF